MFLPEPVSRHHPSSTLSLNNRITKMLQEVLSLPETVCNTSQISRNSLRIDVGCQRCAHSDLEEGEFCHLPAGQPFFQNLVSTIIRKGMVDEFNPQVSADSLPAVTASGE